MKKTFTAALISLFFTAALAQMDHTGITVTGTGTTYGEPDQATIELGLESVNEDINTASAEADRIATALMSVFERLGIEDQDVRTAYFNVWREAPLPQEEAPGEALYHVQNVMSITVRDVSLVGQLIKESISAGANVINTIQYTISDSAELEQQARALAMQEATSKAQDLATLAGVELGNVVMITDDSSVIPPPPVPYELMATSATPVTGGRLGVTAKVSVRYEIVQPAQ